MEQEKLANHTPQSRLETFSKDELIQRYQVLELEAVQLVKELYRLKNERISDSQVQLILQEQLSSLKQKVFGKSSERYKKPVKNDEDDQSPKDPKPHVKKPSERYPNLPVQEKRITQDPAPACPCCQQQMTDSGMTEDAEQLTLIPKKFEITLLRRVKYRCSCQGAVVTAPAPARIIPGSTYSDEMIQDVALSKYCDLIPMERYTAMAARLGLVGLPPHSLIETTHFFADFVSPVYTLIRKRILAARVLHADETPHRMLEGSDKKSWYLWGFSTAELCYLECRNSRSGDVASTILDQSKCEVLISDVFAGYKKAVRISNEARTALGKALIKNAYCNAHARRYFFKAFPHHKETAFYLDHYHEIYQLNSKSKGQSPPFILECREKMRAHFEAMRKKALEELEQYPKNGKYGKALRYFLAYYDSFILFLTDAEVAIDNNLQERNLRSHVMGRKSWYGTHSERGALTAAVLFTLIETCKLNQVNPREYFEHLVQDLLVGSEPYTPIDFKKSN